MKNSLTERRKSAYFRRLHDFKKYSKMIESASDETRKNFAPKLKNAKQDCESLKKKLESVGIKV